MARCRVSLQCNILTRVTDWQQVFKMLHNNWDFLWTSFHYTFYFREQYFYFFSRHHICVFKQQQYYIFISSHLSCVSHLSFWKKKIANGREQYHSDDSLSHTNQGSISKEKRFKIIQYSRSMNENSNLSADFFFPTIYEGDKGIEFERTFLHLFLKWKFRDVFNYLLSIANFPACFP